MHPVVCFGFGIKRIRSQEFFVRELIVFYSGGEFLARGRLRTPFNRRDDRTARNVRIVCLRRAVVLPTMIKRKTNAKFSSVVELALVLIAKSLLD